MVLTLKVIPYSHSLESLSKGWWQQDAVWWEANCCNKFRVGENRSKFVSQIAPVRNHLSCFRFVPQLTQGIYYHVLESSFILLFTWNDRLNDGMAIDSSESKIQDDSIVQKAKSAIISESNWCNSRRKEDKIFPELCEHWYRVSTEVALELSHLSLFSQCFGVLQPDMR